MKMQRETFHHMNINIFLLFFNLYKTRKHLKYLLTLITALFFN